jgi:hypothetical protein
LNGAPDVIHVERTLFYTFAISRDERFAATANRSAWRVSDIAKKHTVATGTLSTGRFATAFAFTPDGRALLAASDAGRVFAIDPLSGKETAISKESDDGWITTLAVTSDGTRVVAGTVRGALVAFALPGLETLGRLDGEDTITALATDEDELVAGTETGMLLRFKR